MHSYLGIKLELRKDGHNNRAEHEVVSWLPTLHKVDECPQFGNVDTTKDTIVIHTVSAYYY